MLEFNATLIAQIIDLIALLLVFGLVYLVLRHLSYHKKLRNDIETMTNELKEIKNTLQERK